MGGFEEKKRKKKPISILLMSALVRWRKFTEFLERLQTSAAVPLQADTLRKQQHKNEMYVTFLFLITWTSGAGI